MGPAGGHIFSEIRLKSGGANKKAQQKSLILLAEKEMAERQGFSNHL
jgi:hypothetical protein